MESEMAFDQISFLSVSDIGKKYIMFIPEYQRGYSWGVSQWDDFWDDIQTIAKSPNINREHYAGSIMISQRNISDVGVVEVDLIDGQQRWTTIAIINKILGGQSFQIKYIKNEGLQTYFDYFVNDHLYLNTRLAEHSSYYARNIKEAYLYFKNKVQGLSSVEQEKLLNVINSRVKLFTLSIEPMFDVHVAFETINNRGKPLSTLEKLKNRLIYLSSNSCDNEASVKAVATIHTCWKSIYRWLGQGQELLSDDEFLRAHALGWFKHEKRAEWLTSQLFDITFSAHSTVSPADIEKYVISLEQASLWWYRLNYSNETMPSFINKRLVLLKRTPSSMMAPLLLWSLMRLSHENPQIVEDPIGSANIFRTFEDLIFQLERFAVLVVLANARQSTYGQPEIYRLSNKLSITDSDYFSIEGDQKCSNRCCIALVAEHVETMLRDGPEDIFIGDDEWVESDASVANQNINKYFSSSQMRDVIFDRFRARKGFYGWNLGRLIIYNWEEHLRGDGGLPEKRSWETMCWDETIEHIYPQKPHDKWRESIHFHGNKSRWISDAVKNSIGNLMLLSRSRNAKASHFPFKSFDGIKGKIEGFREGSYSEVQVANLCNDWTLVQIAARGIAMLRHAQKSWDFEVVSDAQPLTDWYPFLFGEDWERICKEGASRDKKPLNTRSLNNWVRKFEGAK